MSWLPTLSKSEGLQHAQHASPEFEELRGGTASPAAALQLVGRIAPPRAAAQHPPRRLSAMASAFTSVQLPRPARSHARPDAARRQLVTRPSAASISGAGGAGAGDRDGAAGSQPLAADGSQASDFGESVLSGAGGNLLADYIKKVWPSGGGGDSGEVQALRSQVQDLRGRLWFTTAQQESVRHEARADVEKARAEARADVAEARAEAAQLRAEKDDALQQLREALERERALRRSQQSGDAAAPSSPAD